MYLSYLRFTFHTCYYCVTTSDHIEELQRKCIKHVRKPLSKQSLAEFEQQADTKPKDEEVDTKVDEPTETDESPALKEEEGKGRESPEKPKDGLLKERDPKGGEPRDWKRNGNYMMVFRAKVGADPRFSFQDERWVETLDNKLALLINKDGIDVRDYGGKRYEE